MVLPSPVSRVPATVALSSLRTTDAAPTEPGWIGSLKLMTTACSSATLRAPGTGVMVRTDGGAASRITVPTSSRPFTARNFRPMPLPSGSVRFRV